MENTLNFNTVSQYNDYNNHETLHPLVSILDFSKAAPRKGGRMNFGLYAIFLKEVDCGDLRYGRELYDYQDHTLVFLAPGQVIDIDNKGEYYQPKGQGLVFHPDLLLGTSLNKKMDQYNFFSYHSNEALHLSTRERKMVLECFAKIEYELHNSIDKHSKLIIVSNIELFLNYCIRFYDRQFITREHVNKAILIKFEELLNGYFNSGKPREIGLPSVAYFAEELHLSANYFGDLIKKDSGKSAQEYIHTKIIETIKEKMYDHNLSLSEISYQTGFKYPQHFTRFFKQHTGSSPTEFRLLISVN
ncbi:helix-turn-helix protein [Flavobacterium sp. 90]|uniref:helix-turn-helix domain-containing protein n=1 Tax=unclassified Flavobacterium TaxID=196869 RepID=UPI000EB46713|nr:MULTISPECIES: helix-turn-helix domain-containing protein [unclassified Flavobacterium]RKR05109.1 helix-turn-helix protein [Flavobacterium sp. 81]TCK56425.1 helix-turn-helix protein [Flavobacterium sp. 90]